MPKSCFLCEAEGQDTSGLDVSSRACPQHLIWSQERFCFILPQSPSSRADTSRANWASLHPQCRQMPRPLPASLLPSSLRNNSTSRELCYPWRNPTMNCSQWVKFFLPFPAIGDSKKSLTPEHVPSTVPSVKQVWTHLMCKWQWIRNFPLFPTITLPVIYMIKFCWFQIAFLRMDFLTSRLYVKE